MKMFSWWSQREDPLDVAESKMLSVVRVGLRKEKVKIEENVYINTIHADGPESVSGPEKPTLVLVHGFGSGVGWWCKNYDELSKHYRLKALDVLGFAGSSRPPFKGSPEEAQDWFVESLEKWRIEVGLKTFFLLGHSMGGYIVSCYALKYPQYVQHLILCDPVGISKPPEDWGNQLPFVWKLMLDAAWSFGPFFALRLSGRYGLKKLRERRADLEQKFPFEDPSVIYEYLYECNIKTPSGEHAFISMFLPGAWAANPLEDSLPLVKVPHTTFLYGERSWVTHRSSLNILHKFRHSKVNMHILPHGTHHFYADSTQSFHHHLIECKLQTLSMENSFIIRDETFETTSLGGDIPDALDVVPEWAQDPSTLEEEEEYDD